MASTPAVATKLTAKERNLAIAALANEFFELAKQKKFKPLADDLDEKLDALFSLEAPTSLREILLTIVHARLIDASYKATVDLYACKPRSIFEHPLRSALVARRIPHGQSGPLNMAKGIQALNDAWAASRQDPQLAAMALRLVRHVEKLNTEALKNFAVILHAKFLQLETEVTKLNYTAPENSDPQKLYELCRCMIRDQPDSGNTPQRICGYLLQAYHEAAETGIEVSGHNERACVTSTTSGKPGDVIESSSTSGILSCYEITVKKFGTQRVDECVQAFNDYNSDVESPIAEIIVLCRPEDCHPDAKRTFSAASVLGVVEESGYTFTFINLFDWIAQRLIQMNADARCEFFKLLQGYVHAPSTNASVKKYWADYLKKMS